MMMMMMRRPPAPSFHNIGDLHLEDLRFQHRTKEATTAGTRFVPSQDHDEAVIWVRR